MESMTLPSSIDDPQMFLFLSIEELFIFAFTLCFGVIMGHPLILGIVGIMGVMFFRSYRETKAEGYLLHLLYWYGFAPISGGVPNPFVRRALPQ